MALEIVLNGQVRVFAELESRSTITQLIEALELKADRVAIELNGSIAPRASWAETEVIDSDRLELVHFVGGGAF
jgi:thiamine biosynthesis protein ThiS